ncbi:hypothetical protein [Streptomyces sp. NPDC002078]
MFGESPYGKSAYARAGQSADTSQFQKSPAFIGTINSDPALRDVIHVGDIHSGKEFCTEDYDASIASVWQTFTKPLVHMPGDNEWADCHKASNLTSPGEGGGFYDSASDAINYVGRSGLSTHPADCVSCRCGNPPGRTLGSGRTHAGRRCGAFWIAHLAGGLPPGKDHVHQVAFIVLSLAGLLLPVRVFFPRRDHHRLT